MESYHNYTYTGTYIVSHPNDIKSFNNLKFTHIEKSLDVSREYNNHNNDLSGFENLIYIGDDLDLAYYNKSLSGFKNLKIVENDIYLNEKIKDISPLHNLEYFHNIYGYKKFNKIDLLWLIKVLIKVGENYTTYSNIPKLIFTNNPDIEIVNFIKKVYKAFIHEDIKDDIEKYLKEY